MSISLLEGAGSAAAVPSRAVAAQVQPTATQAADISSARVAARLSGKRVEALSERTETSTTWVNKDGSLTTELSAGPVRFQDPTTGDWRDVDVKLTAEADGSVVSKAHPRGLRLAGKSGTRAASLRAAQSAPATDLVTLGSGDEAITLQWRGGLPTPELDGTRATYGNAVPGANVVVEATRTGFEQFVEVKTRPEPGFSYTLPLLTKGLKIREQADGSVLFTDKKSKKSAVMPAPMMWDATVDKRSGEHTNRARVGLEVVRTKGGVDLVITPDADFLADPSTAYPVTVDPSTSSLSNVFDTYVQQGETVDWSTDKELDFGNPGTKNANGTPRTAESFISWNTTPIQDALILNAKLSLWNFHSANTDCKLYPWEVWSSGAASTSSRWTNRPTMTAKKATSTETRGNADCTSQPDGWINADVTTLTQEWASAKANRSHMGIRATSESVVAQWKRVNSANAASNPPKLVVNYNYRPRTGTKQEAGPPYFSYGGTYMVNTVTPTLRDTFIDPNGDKVNGTFQIFDNATDTQVGDVLVSKFAASGQVASVTVPTGVLAHGKTYKFRTSPYDGTHYNTGWSAWKTFTVDTTSPSAPTGITSADYPPNDWVKGAGQAGTFTVTPPASDHNWLEWSLDGVTWTKAATNGASGAKALSVTPAKNGTHTLQVRTVDKADNKSEAIEYGFHVGPGGFIKPSEGERTARRMELVADADGAKYDAVSFSWRRSEADAWTRIPTADVTSGDTALTAWPVPMTNGRNKPLVWDAARTVAPDGSIQLKADFTGPGSPTGATQPLGVVVDADANSSSSSRVGPGTLNLLTGDFGLSEVEASYFGLSVNRSASSRTPVVSNAEEGQAPVFGKEWTSGITAELTESDYTYVRRISDTSVAVMTNNGDEINFTANASRTGWIGEAGSQTLSLKGSVTGDFTLVTSDGSVTTFKKLDATSTTWNVTSTRLDGKADSTTTIVSETVTVGSKRLARPVRVVAPTSAVASATCGEGPSTKGCRVLEYDYADSTTATATTLGDFIGQVKSIRLWSTGPGATAATSKAVQSYAYDTDGRLREAWNPQISPALKTAYSYDAAGRITGLTPAGELPWTFTYGKVGSSPVAGDGMLLKVSRPALKPGTTATVEGTAVTSLVYEVPLTGVNAPYQMGSAAVAAWGQQDVPTDATAIFPADSIPAAHIGSGLNGKQYERASVSYLGASGRPVNGATPGGHISVAESDRFGNTIRELTASNRTLAMGISAQDRAQLADLGIASLPSAERAYLLSTSSTYNPSGTQAVEQMGPLHRVDLTKDLKDGSTVLVAGGTSVPARTWTVNSYDDGRPTDGTASIKDQTTRSVTGASVRGHDTIMAAEQRSDTRYDWVAGLPIATVKDPAGLNLVTTTHYDTRGRITAVIPPGATDTDASARLTEYWSATGTGRCKGRPEWADQPCWTGPGGNITGGGTQPAELVQTTTEYDWWGNKSKISETANGITRTSTTSYDAAGRPVAVTTTGGTGQAVPTATTTYDASSGLEARTTSPTGGDITRLYDKLGRQISYTDVDGGTTEVQFDLLDRPLKASDSVPSTVTFAYNHTAEPRGFATRSTDSVAGSFEAAYDADGAVASETLPGGFVMTQEKSPTGDATSRTYTKASDGTVVLSDRVSESAAGRQTRHTGWSDQAFAYDGAARLTTVEDTADSVCTRRVYGFDQRSNRKSLTTVSAAPGVSCATTGGTTTTHAHDSADRLTDPGYSYDAFGRITAAPGHGSLGYYANDLVHQQTTGGKRQTWALDAMLRFRSWKVESGSGSSWTQTAAKVNHYDSDNDNPRWIVEDTTTGALTRYVENAASGLAATTSRTGDIVLQLTNIHGDIALQLPLDISKAPVVMDNDEYGAPRAGQTPARYGWQGSEQRSTETLTGLTLMGVRLYDPARGRFLQTDPVSGGSANAYDYANQDPCGASDVSGTTPNCGKKRFRNGYGMRIVTTFRGGGKAKSNGWPYRSYQVNVQIMGWTNRYVAKNMTRAETWGVKPGRSNKQVKLQSKNSWSQVRATQWFTHYNIQVKPGTKIWTGGQAIVIGWNSFVASMTDTCIAK
ncbi:DNRLRE domain-containing protein [Streptomyces sp. NPDC002403]